MIIPHDQLRPETLEALMEEFVTRDGAVHGHSDIALDRQIRAVREQLASGKAVIVFDETTESCSIMLSDVAAERESLAQNASDEQRIDYDQSCGDGSGTDDSAIDDSGTQDD